MGRKLLVSGNWISKWPQLAAVNREISIHFILRDVIADDYFLELIFWFIRVRLGLTAFISHDRLWTKKTLVIAIVTFLFRFTSKGFKNIW